MRFLLKQGSTQLFVAPCFSSRSKVNHPLCFSHCRKPAMLSMVMAKAKTDLEIVRLFTADNTRCVELLPQLVFVRASPVSYRSLSVFVPFFSISVLIPTQFCPLSTVPYSRHVLYCYQVLLPMDCTPVFLPMSIIRGSYLGYCKQILWPAFHNVRLDSITRPHHVTPL